MSNEKVKVKAKLVKEHEIDENVVIISIDSINGKKVFGIDKSIIDQLEEPTPTKSVQELIEKWESAEAAAEFYGKGKTEELVKYMNEFITDLKTLNTADKAEPHLFNIAGYMMEYSIEGKLNEEDLIDLIDKELKTFYKKEEKKHPLLKAFDDKAKEYKEYESTSQRLQEVRKVIVKALEEVDQ